MQNQPAHGVVPSHHCAPDVELIDGRWPYLYLVSNIEVPDVADNPYHAVALVGVHDLVEDYLAGGRALYQDSVPDDWHNHYITCGIDVECLVGRTCRPVSSLWPGHALYQVQGLQGLHLV